MPPKHVPAMHRQDDRLATFEAVSKPKSRARHAWPLSPSTHPELTPANMAHAGFYYTPGGSESMIDTCRCFLCGVQLGGWAEDDDPWSEHVSRGGCAWAETVCQVEVERRAGLVATYANQEDLPSSSTSSYVRENTFYSKDREECWWPHADQKDFTPSPTTLAEAGFVFCPTVDEPDLVKCPLCAYEVEGWEADDDPMEIHRKKRPECAFFATLLSDQNKRTTKKKGKVESDDQPAQTTTKRGHTRTNSRSQATASGPGTRTRQQTSEAPSEVAKPVKATRARPKRGKKQDQEGNLGQRIDEGVDEDQAAVLDEDDDDIEVVEELPKRGGRTKATKSKSSRKGAEEEASTAPQTQRGRKSPEYEDAAAAPERVDDAPLDEQAAELDVAPVSQPGKKATASKSKSKSSRKTIKPANPVDQVDRVVEEHKAEEAPAVSMHTKKSRSQTNARTMQTDTSDREQGQDEDEAAEEQSQDPKSRSKSTKANSARTDQAASEPISTQPRPESQSEGIETDQPIKTKAKTGRKPRATKAKKPTGKDETEGSSSQSQTSREKEVVETVRPTPAATSPSRKPLPPLPDPSPARPLSHLDRFTNIPPSSPVSAPAPSDRPTKAIPKKTKGISQPNPLNRQALDSGALAARSVVDQSLDVLLSHPHSDSGSGQKETGMNLSMTLEEWIRAEMMDKKREIERSGHEMIRAFEERTKEARRRIEAIPTR